MQNSLICRAKCGSDRRSLIGTTKLPSQLWLFKERITRFVVFHQKKLLWQIHDNNWYTRVINTRWKQVTEQFFIENKNFIIIKSFVNSTITLFTQHLGITKLKRGHFTVLNSTYLCITHLVSHIKTKLRTGKTEMHIFKNRVGSSIYSKL